MDFLYCHRSNYHAFSHIGVYYIPSSITGDSDTQDDLVGKNPNDFKTSIPVVKISNISAATCNLGPGAQTPFTFSTMLTIKTRTHISKDKDYLIIR